MSVYMIRMKRMPTFVQFPIVETCDAMGMTACTAGDLLAAHAVL